MKKEFRKLINKILYKFGYIRERDAMGEDLNWHNVTVNYKEVLRANQYKKQSYFLVKIYLNNLQVFTVSLKKPEEEISEWVKKDLYFGSLTIRPKI